LFRGAIGTPLDLPRELKFLDRQKADPKNLNQLQTPDFTFIFEGLPNVNCVLQPIKKKRVENV